MRCDMTRPSMVQFGCVGARCFRVGTARGGAGMTLASNAAQAAQYRVFLRSMRFMWSLRISQTSNTPGDDHHDELTVSTGCA